MTQKGFTLVELVMVITILGILAVSALPSFINITGQAERASRDGVVGAIRAGIALQRANNMVTGSTTVAYPATLDGASLGACSSSNRCFGNVLSQGLSDGSWSVTTAGLVYTFNDGTTTYTYTYTPGTFAAPVGTFNSPTAP